LIQKSLQRLSNIGPHDRLRKSYTDLIMKLPWYDKISLLPSLLTEPRVPSRSHPMTPINLLYFLGVQTLLFHKAQCRSSNVLRQTVCGSHLQSHAPKSRYQPNSSRISSRRMFGSSSSDARTPRRWCRKSLRNSGNSVSSTYRTGRASLTRFFKQAKFALILRQG
jgi:hypothetical protein